MTPQEHVVAALENTPKLADPYPHFYVENVFPADFYDELMAKLAVKRDFHAEKFANRTFADSLADFPELDFMKSKAFFHAMLRLFPEELKRDFGGRKVAFYRDLRLIRDQQNYKIGPHTDAAWKVLSLLFYLPATDAHRECGTVIYEPLDGAFRCAGGPHYPFDLFREVARAPYIPNSCLGFYKTSHSFHGVPPITTELRRDVLLFNIYQKDAFDASHPAPTPKTSPQTEPPP